METVAQLPSQGDANSIAIALVGLITAITTLVTVFTYAKVAELRTRVRDVQHKVGADHRDGD
jgi:hypothetical protein